MDMRQMKEMKVIVKKWVKRFSIINGKTVGWAVVYGITDKL
jgi:hypothetical protein